MNNLNRTDIYLILALDNGNADCPAFGLTITELMDYIAEQGIPKSRMTVYRRLRGLVASGYIGKGVMENHADTFYILESGKNLISKKRKGE